MSRRKGTRARPKPEQQRRRARYSSGGRERQPRQRRPMPEGPITRRRRWGSAIAATTVLVFAFGAVVFAIVATSEDDLDAASTAVAFAAGLTPIAFTVMAIGSRHQHPVKAVFTATAIALVGFVGVGALLREPATAIVFSAGVAGAFALRAEPGVHNLSLRVSAVSLASLVTLVTTLFAPDIGIVIAPFLPFPAVVAADVWAEARLGD